MAKTQVSTKSKKENLAATFQTIIYNSNSMNTSPLHLNKNMTVKGSRQRSNENVLEFGGEVFNQGIDRASNELSQFETLGYIGSSWFKLEQNGLFTNIRSFSLKPSVPSSSPS